MLADTEKERKSIENLKTVLNIVFRPEFLETCTPNIVTDLDVGKNPTFVESILQSRTRGITKYPHNSRPAEKKETYTVKTLVNNPELAKLLSIPVLDADLQKKLTIDENQFDLDIQVGFITDEQGNIKEFSIDPISKVNKVIKEVFFSENRNTAYPDTGIELTRGRMTNTEGAMRRMFNNVPPTDDARWSGGHGDILEFYMARTIKFPAGNYSLRYDYGESGNISANGQIAVI